MHESKIITFFSDLDDNVVPEGNLFTPFHIHGSKYVSTYIVI